MKTVLLTVRTTPDVATAVITQVGAGGLVSLKDDESQSRSRNVLHHASPHRASRRAVRRTAAKTDGTKTTRSYQAHVAGTELTMNDVIVNYYADNVGRQVHVAELDSVLKRNHFRTKSWTAMSNLMRLKGVPVRKVKPGTYEYVSR